MRWYDNEGRPNYKVCGHLVGYACVCHLKEWTPSEEMDCVDYFNRQHWKYVEEDEP